VVLFEEARRDDAHAALRIILRGEGDGAALRRLRQRLVAIVHETLLEHGELLRATPVVPVTVLTEMLVGEIVAVLAWWVEQEEPDADARHVVGWLRASALYGRLWALGIDDDVLNSKRAAAYRAGLPPREGS
jgi:hypothetical protein